MIFKRKYLFIITALLITTSIGAGFLNYEDVVLPNFEDSYYHKQQFQRIKFHNYEFMFPKNLKKRDNVFFQVDEQAKLDNKEIIIKFDKGSAILWPMFYLAIMPDIDKNDTSKMSKWRKYYINEVDYWIEKSAFDNRYVKYYLYKNNQRVLCIAFSSHLGSNKKMELAILATFREIMTK